MVSVIGDVALIELIEVSEPVESEPEEELDFELQDIANVATMLAKRMYFFIVFVLSVTLKKCLCGEKSFVIRSPFLKTGISRNAKRIWRR